MPNNRRKAQHRSKMSRGKHDSTRCVYLRIADGKIVENVDAGAEGAIQRTNKNGKIVHERLDDYVDGTITTMFMRSHEHNGKTINELCIRLQDKDEYYQLSLQVGNRYWVAFVMRLPNLDLTRPIRFSPYHFTPKGESKPLSGLNLYQGGQKIAPKWSKTDPGDLPQGKQVEFQGEMRWDFHERDTFLHRIEMEYIDQLKVGDEAMAGTAPVGDGLGEQDGDPF